MTGHSSTHYIVIGGGIVGASVAWGLLRRGHQVLMLDEGDIAHRASRGNFGLIWVQGKGGRNLDYARWTCRSAATWPAFAAELTQATGIDLQRQQSGGLEICLDEQELAEQEALLGRIAAGIGQPYPWERLTPAQLAELAPGASPTLPGATFCPLDGHVSPLRLLRALHQACALHGGHYLASRRVVGIERQGGEFTVTTGNGRFSAPRLILAAGLGNRALAAMVGIDAPVSPQRGEVLITERLPPLLRLPTSIVRQTAEGTLQIGYSNEPDTADEETEPAVLAGIARRAMRCFPALAHANVVRSWGALRVLTPDGLPLYQHSASHPGASVVTCHSGVTLAAAHALHLTPWLEQRQTPAEIVTLTAERFHV